MFDPVGFHTHFAIVPDLSNRAFNLINYISVMLDYIKFNVDLCSTNRKNLLFCS
jgi:hypothetical protein